MGKTLMYQNVRKKQALNPPVTSVPHQSILKWSQPSLSVKLRILHLRMSYPFIRSHHRRQRIKVILRKVSQLIRGKGTLLISRQTPNVSLGSLEGPSTVRLVGVRLHSFVLVAHVQKNYIRVHIAWTCRLF